MRKPIDVSLTELCEIYGKNRTKALDKYWTIGLAKYSDVKIVKALKGYYERNESHFFPTPFEFIEFSIPLNPYPHL